MVCFRVWHLRLLVWNLRFCRAFKVLPDFAGPENLKIAMVIFLHMAHLRFCPSLPDFAGPENLKTTIAARFCWAFKVFRFSVFRI